MIYKKLRHYARMVRRSIRRTSRYVHMIQGGATPDFLVIGAQKAGTTALFHLLTRHTHINTPTKKEVHFFDDRFSLGFDWYESHFSNNGKLNGEASPSYLFSPLLPERVKTYHPNMKLIVILRDPVKRAYSHYWHNVRKRRESRSFSDAMRWEEKAVFPVREFLLQQSDMYAILRKKGYLSRGLYAEQLNRWFKYFSHEQVLVLFSDDLYHRHQEVLDTCFDFLGVPPEQISQNIRNKGSKPEPIDPVVEKELEGIFDPFDSILEDLIKQKLPW